MASIPNIPDDLRNAIRLEAYSAVSKWLVGAIVALIGLAVLGWWALLGPWLARQLGAVPPNTIIAIDSERECPHPWQNVEALAGKILVAAGRDRNGADWAPKDTGGQTQVTLVPEQIPPHQHEIRALLTGDALGGTVTGSGYIEGGNFAGRLWVAPAGEPYAGSDRSKAPTRKTEAQHAAPTKPVQTMPPYYVVRFCRRS